MTAEVRIFRKTGLQTTSRGITNADSAWIVLELVQKPINCVGATEFKALYIYKT